MWINSTPIDPVTSIARGHARVHLAVHKFISIPVISPTYSRGYIGNVDAVGSLATYARARKRERERVPEAAGMAVPRINRVQSERVLCSSGKGNEGNVVYIPRGRETVRGRRRNKRERERVGCGTQRGGGEEEEEGGNGRLAYSGENGGRDKERKSSLSSCVQTRVACGLRILHGNLARNPPPFYPPLSPSQSRDHTLARAGKYPRVSPCNVFTAIVTRFRPSSSGDGGIDVNFFLSFFRPGDDRGG